MPVIIGVRFNDAGKVYYFDPGSLTMKYHDHVIVETARGTEYGTVVISPTEVPEEKAHGPLKKVIRMATPDDDERERTNREKEKDAYRTCKKKIAEHGLDMKLIGAEYTFDNSKLLFYFTAEGRIDFRELVKDLAGIFRTRIELRQIGVRDETKLLGGVGSCGRPLCCHTWLNEFAPVSIKMAKDQNLSLNPTKISGTCGRLMCCLKNEAETYAYLNRDLPGKGDFAMAEDGRRGDVHSVNILRQTVKVIVELDNDEKELQEFDVKDLTFVPKAQKFKFREQLEQQEAEASGRNGSDRRRKEHVPAGARNDRAQAEAPEEAAPAASAASVGDMPGGEAAGAEGERRARRPRRRKKPAASAEAGAQPAASAARPDEAGHVKEAAAPAGGAAPDAAGQEKKRRRRRRPRRGPKENGDASKG
ncbi:MAG: stage 0 sporulation family protein [Lachnospiraceae bacterium]|nr:stage 0 sporulation family protein [Lachnospiraceae bacterium]